MKTAIFTMAKNESKYLPVWTKYYAQHFENIYILDHASDDGSIETACSLANIKTRRLDYPIFNDFEWYTGTISRMQIELLESYEVVVFCEPDEMLWHPDGIGNYSSQLQGDYVRARGFNIVHMPHEKSLDWSQPILCQRSHWFKETSYDKTLISRKPINWVGGFHGCAEDSAYDKNLFLIHLHHVDRGYTEQRGIEKTKWNWSEKAIQSQGGTYILDAEQRKVRRNHVIKHAVLMSPKLMNSQCF